MKPIQVMEIKVENSCSLEKESCLGCNSHFMKMRPLIKSVVISKHFKRDVKDQKEAEKIVKSILDCSHVDYTELHKFEESIDGIMVFRAKKEHHHIVYCIDNEMRLVFLRLISNFDEYRKFMEDKKEIKRMVEDA
jgi:mRNA-degrading endonuclease RelE of RelBE toxin-antitoxin system